MASISVAGDTSGSITISAPLVAGSGTLTLPTGTDTLVGLAATQTLTNKTLTAPALGTPASGLLTNCTSIPASQLTGTVAVANGGTGVSAQSYVRVNTANGYGSTNNKIRRFTNIVNNVGSDITYADSATLGATFTINTAGVYSAHFSEVPNAVSAMGISINSTQLTTNIVDITTTDILAASACVADARAGNASATFYATAASVIRAHTQGLASGSSSLAGSQFTIARVA